MVVAIRIAIMALVAALIGWITNLLAIKMIFRPLNPIRIPILGIEMQGLIPKRKKDIAESIGRTVEEQLISMDDVFNTIVNDKNKDYIIEEMKDKILEVVHEKMPKFIPYFIKDNVSKYVGDVIDEQAEGFIDSFVENTVQKTVKKISIAQMVEDKINAFDLITLENLIISISSKELKHIEVLGGFLGFFIGLIQGIVMQFMPFK